MNNETLNKPLDFSTEVDPESVGMSRRGVQKIVDLFEEQFLKGLQDASQLVVLRHGRVVLDRTLGVIRLGSKISVKPTTPFLVFSVTKPFTGMLIHKLIEMGKVELDAPIADYWPEFGTKGKESATIRHALLHQAGIPAKGIFLQVPQWSNWNRVVRNVAGLAAEFEPGSKTAYHLVNYGFILGEVVRRVTGRPIEDFMRDQIFIPLGMRNSYLGLPISEASRAAELNSEVPDQQPTAAVFRKLRHAVLPAATLNAPARDIAKFYQMLLNGGQYNGYRFVNQETVEAATAVGSEGIDYTFGENMFVRWGYGFSLGGPKPQGVLNENVYSMGRRSSVRTFGHPGQRSSFAWADKDQQLAVVFNCNRLQSEEVSVGRWQSISEVVWEALER